MTRRTSAGAAALFCLVGSSAVAVSTYRPTSPEHKGFRASDDEMKARVSAHLTYRCTVPGSVPTHLEWHNDGQPILVDGPGRYQSLHHAGWCEFMFFFLTDQVDVLTHDWDSVTFYSGPHFAKVCPWNDGFGQCRAQLRTLVMQFGAHRVKTAIRAVLATRDGAWWWDPE